jgi:RNA polymerase sigma factor (sigma-70 family)
MGSQLDSDRRGSDLVQLYLESIGRYQLLTAEQERQLAEQIRLGLEAKQQLDGPGRLSPARRRRLQQAARQSELAVEQFVQANLRLVVSIAKRYQSPGLLLLDLVQEGNIGLIRAISRFDGNRGTKFSTFATWWIRQSISRYVDSAGRNIRLPTHTNDRVRRAIQSSVDMETELRRPPTLEELASRLGDTPQQVGKWLQQASRIVSLDAEINPDSGAGLGDILADTSSLSPVDSAIETAAQDELYRQLRQLNPRERQILQMRFGLAGYEQMTLDEVGAQLHLTRERTRQLEIKAIARLRHGSGSRALWEFLTG